MRKTMTKFKDEDSRGFTLIEVLISMAITIVVMGAVFGLLTRGQRSFQREPQVAELQQSARTALDMVSKDVLQAGAGLPVEFPSFTTTAINPSVGDGGTGPDVIEIVGSSSSAGEMYYAPEPVVNFDGSTNVTLGLAPTGLEVGNLVVVYDNNELSPNWVMGFVTAVNQTPPEAIVTLDATFGTAIVPGGYTNNPDGFTAGFITRVSVVQYSTQLQGNDLILRRQVDFGQINPVGMLDDFQVAYLVGTQPQIEQLSPPPPQPTRGILITPADIISGIRVTVAARSTQENLAGSSQGASGDYIRKTFSSNISPRNVLAGCAERLGTQCSI